MGVAWLKVGVFQAREKNFPCESSGSAPALAIFHVKLPNGQPFPQVAGRALVLSM